MKKILFAIFLMSCAICSLADDREQLIGVWKLQTFELEFQDTGERIEPFGAHPNGYGIFTREGRTIAVLTAEGRAAPRTDADRAAAFKDMIAYTGIYRIEGDHWITRVDTSWNESWVGTDQIRFFQLDGDTLSVTSNFRPSPNYDGRIARGHIKFVRDK